MIDFNLVRQMRKDSKELASIIDNENDGRHAYDEFVFGTSQRMWGRRLANGKRFDANSSLALYELSLSIDNRIIQQMVETSYLRKKFVNFPGESIFSEYTGINPTTTVYVPLQLESTGTDTTSTNKSSRVKPSTNPNEMKTIKAAISPIRRPVVQYQEGFEMTLGDLELASYLNIPLQDSLTKRVARDLTMQEQFFAFNHQPDGIVAPEEFGLLFNTAISSAITWTAGALLSPSTTGRAIIDEFNRIRGVILRLTKNVFAGENQPLCVITSVENVNALMRTYSDLDGKAALTGLTEREFRIAGLPILNDNQAFFYYQDFENIELSTSRMVEAQPQSYTAKNTSWFFPFRNITAGVTVKRKESIYFVAGMNP